MDINRSLEILGPHCSQEYVENLAAAFKLFKGLNTPAENEKLAAAEYALADWKTFQRIANWRSQNDKRKKA